MTWQERIKLEPETIQGRCDCSPEEVGYDSSRIKALNRHIQSMIERNMIFSGSYCLSRHGKIFANTALGRLACPWQGREVFTPDTFFELQSVGKLMTAIAVLKLAEDGVIYLDQPVYDWIPEFDRKDFRKITILHCLTHTSGLAGLPGTHQDIRIDWTTLVDKSDVKDTWIPAIVKAGLRKLPGEEWSYSMAGYLIVGEIIRRAAGMRAEDFIRETVLLPCGMTECHWRSEPKEAWVSRYNIATKEDIEAIARYEKEGAKAFTQTLIDGSNEIPNTAGGQMCTAKELVQFGEMLLNGGTYRGNRVIGKKALEYLFTNMIENNLRDHCWNHPGNRVIYGAGAPIMRCGLDRQQLVSNDVLYHEGHGACMFLVDRKENMVAVYQTRFVKDDDWYWEAVKGMTSVIWSGIK